MKIKVRSKTSYFPRFSFFFSFESNCWCEALWKNSGIFPPPKNEENVQLLGKLGLCSFKLEVPQSENIYIIFCFTWNQPINHMYVRAFIQQRVKKTINYPLNIEDDVSITPPSNCEPEPPLDKWLHGLDCLPVAERENSACQRWRLKKRGGE